MSRFVLSLVFMLFAAGAMAQERPPYGTEVGLDLAKKIAAGAAMLRRPTKALEDAIVKGRVVLMSIAASPVEGGLPIMSGGKVIGGIGVSGANSDQDAAAATAGLKAAGL